ncbi:unnamed protein product [Urochloa humidicola]
MVKYTLLPELRLRDRQSEIRVRVARKWEYREDDNAPAQHIDLVLADEKGNVMHARIPQAQIAQHDPNIQENGTYIIKRFRVANLKDNYRPVHADYMLEFTCYTQIDVAENPPDTFPKYVYKLTEFDDLFTYVGKRTYFLDVLAIITEVDAPDWKHFPGKNEPTLRRNITLQDINGSELRLTLWGTKAAEFSIDNVYSADNPKPIVTLFVGCLMKTFMGEQYLSGNYACKWYFNPEIPEAEIYYNRLQGQLIQIKRPDTPGELPPIPLAPPMVETKSLQELLSIHPYDYPDNGYQCTVTIARLVPNTIWWYPGCRLCNKSMAPDGSGFKCRNCSHTGFDYKLKLVFIATDGTAEAEMICFGSTAVRIVGKSCDYVMRSVSQGHSVPPPIAAIVSEKFTFAIKLTDDSYRIEKKTFIVSSVITSYGKQRTVPRFKASAGTFSHNFTNVLPTKQAFTGPPPPTVHKLLPHNPSPQTPRVVQLTDKDAPPFEPETPEDPSARKRLFIADADDSQKPNETPEKKSKLQPSTSNIEEGSLHQTSLKRNMPPEKHYGSKGSHSQKK